MRKQGSAYESKVGRNRVLTLRPLPPLALPLSRPGGRGAAKENIWAKVKNISLNICKNGIFALQGTAICPGREIYPENI